MRAVQAACRKVGREEAISPVGSGIRLSTIPPEGLAPLWFGGSGVLKLDFVDPVSGSANYKFASFSGPIREFQEARRRWGDVAGGAGGRRKAPLGFDR